MRMLFVVAGLPKGGGGFSEAVPAMALALARRGCEVTIATVCDDGDLAQAALDARAGGVDVRTFAPSWPSRIYFSWSMLRSLGALVRKCDVVYLQGCWTFPIWHGGRLALRHGKRLVMGPAGSLNPVHLRKSWLAKRIASVIDYQLLRRADAVHATSETERGWIIAVRGMESRAERVHVVPLGVEVPPSCATDNVHASPDTLLYLGRIHPMKGLDLLLEALALHMADNKSSPVRIMICGPDESGTLSSLRDLASRLCVSGRVDFVAPVHGEGKWRLIADAGCVVLPSRGENFGISIAEGLAAGRPAICTRACPWPMLESEGIGWLADCDARSLARAIGAFASSSIENRKAMGGRAREFARSHLSPDVMADALMAMTEGKAHSVHDAYGFCAV